MSPNHPPKIDLEALQERLDGLAKHPLAGGVPAPTEQDAAVVAIEHAANGNGHAAPANEDPPVPHLGSEAAANMTKLSKAAAADIRRVGALALEAGRKVQEECEQMACDVEANAGTIALHLTGLSQLLAEVGLSNRDTLRRLLGGVTPSLVPPASSSQVVELPAHTAQESTDLEDDNARTCLV